MKRILCEHGEDIPAGEKAGELMKLYCGACGAEDPGLQCSECGCTYATVTPPTEGELCEGCPTADSCAQFRQDSATPSPS